MVEISVAGIGWFTEFYPNLKENNEIKKEIDLKLDVLKTNAEAGEHVPRNLIPDIYVKRFNITNLFRVDMSKGQRFVYTIKGNKQRKQVEIIEYFSTHNDYAKRFGYD
ncbi:MAG: hypothetical protein ACYDAJ_08450 [Nitrosotalea sp.]